MAKIQTVKQAGNKVVGMDSLRNYSKAPMKKSMTKPIKKMSPKMVAKRKRSTISNAATKVFGQNYSK